MNREQKISVVEEYVSLFDKPGVYLMDFKGLNVAEMTELRRKLRQANVSMRVVKNSLARRALAKAVSELSLQADIENIKSFIVGPTGIVWSQKDSVSPARVLLTFIKQHEKGTIKAGLVDGSLITGKDIEVVSKLPAKNELYRNVASALNAPLAALVSTLNAVPVTFIRTVRAIRE